MARRGVLVKIWMALAPDRGAALGRAIHAARPRYSQELHVYATKAWGETSGTKRQGVDARASTPPEVFS